MACHELWRRACTPLCGACAPRTCHTASAGLSQGTSSAVRILAHCPPGANLSCHDELMPEFWLRPANVQRQEQCRAGLQRCIAAVCSTRLRCLVLTASSLLELATNPASTRSLHPAQSGKMAAPRPRLNVKGRKKTGDCRYNGAKHICLCAYFSRALASDAAISGASRQPSKTQQL